MNKKVLKALSFSNRKQSITFAFYEKMSLIGMHIRSTDDKQPYSYVTIDHKQLKEVKAYIDQALFILNSDNE